ncbi:hypothetical protein C8R47DRAFT_1216224 [Mycena vitilis]|nr:hypothetical protein C8R47DRAFT_1216224 [Mycena vitilis]
MLVEFARLIKEHTGLTWDPVERPVLRTINIATQKLISAYSKSPHFNPREPNAHIPDTSVAMRDEIGLVRAITVKERSSAKRKDLFKTIQSRHQSDPAEIAKQMVLDMKVRWSSTYAMLDRAYSLKDDVDAFVFQMAMDKSGEKRQKLSKLELQKEEWDRVDLFLDLLAPSLKQSLYDCLFNLQKF